jgi:hypothetical protein
MPEQDRVQIAKRILQERETQAILSVRTCAQTRQSEGAIDKSSSEQGPERTPKPIVP